MSALERKGDFECRPRPTRYRLISPDGKAYAAFRLWQINVAVRGA